ncbi:hypothetical protein F5Y18DRAFT_401789 [Xylariaceae sp. FL1019]|nr:hypothetical protein F5Y18DRAFT_401789 [Xylariaceae sp. FL1019]
MSSNNNQALQSFGAYTGQSNEVSAPVQDKEAQNLKRRFFEKAKWPAMLGPGVCKPTIPQSGIPQLITQDQPPSTAWNTITYQERDPSKNKTGIWMGTGSHGVTFLKSMVNRWGMMTKNPDAMENTVTCVIWQHENEEQPADKKGQSRPLFPHTPWTIEDRTAKREAREGKIFCCNCGQVGHDLSECVWPVTPSGDITGCPICNTKEHFLDGCHHVLKLKTAEAQCTLKWKYLVEKRGGKPMIRSNMPIFKLAVELQQKPDRKPGTNCWGTYGMPWRRHITKWAHHDPDGTHADAVNALKNYDYSKGLDLPAHLDLTEDAPLFLYWQDMKADGSYSQDREQHLIEKKAKGDSRSTKEKTLLGIKQPDLDAMEDL